MSLCVLLTSVGGLVSPGIIQNLRDMVEVDKIVGIDASAGAIGASFVDTFYTVSKGDSSPYIPQVLDIARKERVNIVVPCSDEEVLSLSQHKDSFDDIDVKILCSSSSITECAIDKLRMLQYLTEHGITVPKFHTPADKQQFAETVAELGYPHRRVVVKPRRGRGGRGVRYLTPTVDVFDRDNRSMKLDWYLNALPSEAFSKILIMEYLSGTDYSIDVLASSGEVVGAVIRERIAAISGPSTIGEVVANPEVLNLIKEVVRVFGFDSNVNIQMKCAEPESCPMVYEINPRISGTIVAGKAAGIDLLSAGILKSVGMALPDFDDPRPVRMIRHYTEHYIYR